MMGRLKREQGQLFYSFCRRGSLILVGKVCALTTAAVGDVRAHIFYRGSCQGIERDYDPDTPSDFYCLLNGW
jgi:hypothetical protein